jgi:hypothetical protein
MSVLCHGALVNSHRKRTSELGDLEEHDRSYLAQPDMFLLHHTSSLSSCLAILFTQILPVITLS